MTATQVGRFHGTDGGPFRDLLRRVIYTHARTLGIPQSELSGDSTTKPDKGCDFAIHIDAPINDPSGYLTLKSCWQFKGHKTVPSIILLGKELHKARIKELIKKGYVYYLCLSADLTDSREAEITKALTAKVKRINPKAPTPRVLGASRIAEWINEYPALILQYNSLPNIFCFSAWENQITDITKTYVPNPSTTGAEALIANHLVFDQIPIEACFKLGGAAGVGKTRLVFEVVRRVPEYANTVVYTRDEEAAESLASHLSNSHPLRAIIIADECSAEKQQRLNEILRGRRSHVRVVVINNIQDPHLDPAPVPVLTVAPDDVIGEILKKNFPKVSLEHRNAAIRLAQGFVRIAAFYCAHPGGEPHGLFGYVDTKLADDAERTALTALALFEKVGFKGDKAPELDWIATELVRQPSDVLKETCRRLKKSWVVEAGRYFYVTPEAVSELYFVLGWDRWVKDDVLGFLSKLPSELRESFRARVAKCTRTSIRKSLGYVMQLAANTVTIDDLGDKKRGTDFLNLVDIDPSRFLPRLALLLESAPLAKIKSISGAYDGKGWGARRKLVWQAQRFACFPEYFCLAETILLRLSLAETEKGLGNNATETWRQLFRVCLSGTPLSFDDRLVLLKQRLVSPDVPTILLALSALEGSFNNHASRMGTPAIIIGRIPPPEWNPKTQPELVQEMKKGMAEVIPALSHQAPQVRAAAEAILYRHIRFFLGTGYLAFVKKAVSLTDTTNHLPVLLDGIASFEAFDAESCGPAYRKSVSAWKRTLMPKTDANARLRALLSRQHMWLIEKEDQTKFAKDLVSLSKYVIRIPDLLWNNLEWLNSEKALHTFAFGEKLASVDLEFRFFQKIAHAASKNASALIRGYVFGLGNRVKRLPIRITKWLKSLESKDPVLACMIGLVLPKHVDSLAQMIRLFDKKAIRPSTFESLLYRGLPFSLSSAEILEILKRLNRVKGKEMPEAGATALEVAFRFAESEIRAGRKWDGKSVPLKKELETVISKARLGGTMDGFYWEHLARFVAPHAPQLVINKCIKILIEDDLSQADNARNILVEIGRLHPLLVLNSFKAALQSKSGWKLEFRGFAYLPISLPADVFADWLTKQSVKTARQFVSSLQKPYLDPSGTPVVPDVTLKVLTKFGHDEEVQKQFCLNPGVRSYWGDIASQHAEEVKVAEKFLLHPNKAIANWAQVEMGMAKAQEEQWRQHNAEYQIR